MREVPLDHKFVLRLNTSMIWLLAVGILGLGIQGCGSKKANVADSEIGTIQLVSNESTSSSQDQLAQFSDVRILRRHSLRPLRGA